MVPGCSDLACDLVGGQDAAARLDGALDGARLGGRHVHRDGPEGPASGRGRCLPGRGLGLGLAAVAAERAQEGDQQQGADRPDTPGLTGPPA